MPRTKPLRKSLHKTVMEHEQILRDLRQILKLYPDAYETTMLDGHPFIATRKADALANVDGIEVITHNGGLRLYPFVTVGHLRVFPIAIAGKSITRIKRLGRVDGDLGRFLQTAVKAPVEQGDVWIPGRREVRFQSRTQAPITRSRRGTRAAR